MDDEPIYSQSTRFEESRVEVFRAHQSLNMRLQDVTVDTLAQVFKVRLGY